MIIWGFRSYVVTLAMLTLACRNGHTAAHRMAKVTRKFTLFFLPLFPVSTKHLTVCTQCGEQVKWTKEQAEEALASAPRPAVTTGDPVAPPVQQQP